MGYIPPLTFSGPPTNQVRIGNMQGDWDPDRLVAVVTDLRVPVEDALLDIRMNARREVINLECDCEESWIK